MIHVHVLWECPVYDTIRNTFMRELNNWLGECFEEFSTLGRTSFVLGCENWYRSNFEDLLTLTLYNPYGMQVALVL